jgi:hypothetical protein
MSITLGIDIGISGAVVVLSDVDDLLEVHDMPTLQDGPGEGPTGAFAFGRARVASSKACLPPLVSPANS